MPSTGSHCGRIGPQGEQGRTEMIEERGGWLVVNVAQGGKCGAQSPEPTDRVPLAYSDVTSRRKIDPPAWPLG